MLVIEKKAVNLSLPTAAMHEFDKLAQPLNGKHKWLVQTAAILLLLDAKDGVARFVISMVASAEAGGPSIESLLAQAMKGKLASYALEELAKQKPIAENNAEKDEKKRKTSSTSKSRDVA